MSFPLSDKVHPLRVGPVMAPDITRVLLCRWYPTTESCARRLMTSLSIFPRDQAQAYLDRVVQYYSLRHRRDLRATFRARTEEICRRLGLAESPDCMQREFVGSFFMHEYSIEACALFNPSIIPHFDQSGVPEGAIRFILSLRSTGEQHISSITFRTGLVHGSGRITLDPCSKYVTEPLSKDGVLFTFPDSAVDLSERIVFPVTPKQKKGVEDARFVRFREDDGSYRYYGTYTAYDGKDIAPEMISTTDFKSIRFESLVGDIENKGMALFPRKVHGRYYMLSRQDDETTFIMSSDKVLEWHNPKVIQAPKYPWELFKLGNCGSPIETEKGWLVITHGVGAMREYSLALLLLDIDNPERVIARSKRPILVPTEDIREGYVPNVVYTCGAMLHNGMIILPFAQSDYSSSFAIVKLSEVWDELGV